MSNIFDDQGHLSQLAIKSLKAGTLSEIELISTVSHIADCESCANIYADSFNSDELKDVPSGFADVIQNRLYVKKKNNLQFIFYSMRVTAAVCASLLIIFSGALNYITKVDSAAKNFKPPDLGFANSINTDLQNFSNKILNVEVFQNEKEKK